MSEASGSSWWQSLPGVLAAAAGLVTAVAGLVVALNQIGAFKSADRPLSVVTDHKPRQGLGIDCLTDRSPVEQAICDDTKLLDKDRLIVDLYNQVLQGLSGQAQEDFVREQRDWVSGRNQCHQPHVADCLMQRYNERIRDLQAMGHR
jgi:uncharacterized protein YecT (DUF1311 family)